MRARLEFAQCMRDNGVKDFPDPTGVGPLIDVKGARKHSGVPRRGAEVPRPPDGGRGTSEAEDLGVAGAAVLVAVIATGRVVVMSSAQQPAPAAQEPSVNTAKVEKGKLSAMVSEDGTLTYRARSDGSPYSVINQARGTYTKLPAVGRVISQRHVLYRVNGSPVVLLHGSTPAYRTLSARGDRRRRGRAQRGSGRARLCHLGSGPTPTPATPGRVLLARLVLAANEVAGSELAVPIGRDWCLLSVMARDRVALRAW